MEKHTFFSYSWYIDEDETEVTSMRIYGIDKNNDNVCIRVDDFNPYVYLELPENINTSNVQIIGNKIDELLGNNKPIKKILVMKKKLYYAHLDSNKQYKLFPYLCCYFSSVKDIKLLSYKLKRSFYIVGFGNVKIKIHEQDASPILQLCCTQDIQTAGWMEFIGKKIDDKNKVTLCTHEFKVKYKHLSKVINNKAPSPKIMGFDIEVNSSNPSAMPKSTKPGDKVFQISCIIYRDGDIQEDYKKYLLSLGNVDIDLLDKDVIVEMHETEASLLQGFTDLIREENPNIIVGYNILGFDIPYMIDRSKQSFIFKDFSRQGFHKTNYANERTIKWSSSAYKNQEFQFLDAEGRLFVDLLPLVKRDYKLDNYKLKTVSEYFLKDTKDDLSAKGIFKCYRIGMLGGKKGAKALALCGKYCIKDSVLVVKLMEKLQIFIGLTQMASICNVLPFSLYTQGQQIKVFSQVYKYCFQNNIVVEKDGYVTNENERYVGAHVFEPVPGCYDRVVPFDFSSLYPTTIIAYNIDYSTLVMNPEIPDRDCHVMEWSEHISCCHDPKIIRKENLTKYIDSEKQNIKKLREQRDKTKNKEKKQELILKIDDLTKKLKPYQEERSNIVKTKTKFVTCAERRFRFLKEPKGVLPNILENLLDARKNTRSDMKTIKEKLKTTTNKDEIKNLNISYNVLDKRQLAYKISSNSVYGAMGVTRGYLPFMPGAMCLDGNSQISFTYGFTRKMKNLVDTKSLWSYRYGQNMSYGEGLKYNGKKEVVKITLLDGRTLRCTHDHKIMTSNGWVNAGNLLSKHTWNGTSFTKNSEYSKVIVGLELPEDIETTDEKEWKLLDFKMDNQKNRDKTLAFSRILGFILSDGSISCYLNKFDKKLFSCKVSIGTLLDAKLFVNDVKLITGFKPQISNHEREEIKGSIYAIHIPKILLDKILTLEGITIGKRTHNLYTLPSFLLEKNCPISVIREFLGGLFGGDGISPSLSISHPSFSPIGMQLSTIEKYKENMFIYMNNIINLLQKFDIHFWQTPPKLARTRESLKPKDIEENPRWEYMIKTNSCNSLLFAKKIGFRYCSDKNNKLSIASSYQRYSDNLRKQHIDIVLEASKIYDLDNGKTSIKSALEKARKEVYKNEIPLHEYISLAKSTDIYNHRSRPSNLKNYKLLKKYFLTARDYTKLCNCEHWFSENKFSKKVYSLERTDEVSPCFYLDVVNVKNDGVDDVYDIIDVPENSFFANGIVVHNCTTYMGRQNIELVAKTIPEKYGGKLIYGDTDSNYIHFPHLKTAKETWEYSEHVAAEITKMFPKPISLAYEEVIYWRFFILTKKRYMYNSCDKEGNISKKVGKKGVLLARRDNSPFIRKIYEAVITKVFERESKENVINFVLDEINKLCSNTFEYKDFVITKSVGDTGGLSATEITDEKGVTTMKVGVYKVPVLLKDKDERDVQLLKKDATSVEDFYLKSLPGQVQLAEKMRRRGMRVDPGSRLEYVIIESEDNFKDKTSEKMESIDYFANHRDVLKIDFMYYLKLLTNPMDQVLFTAYKEKDFTLKQYKFRIQRCKLLDELKNLFIPKLKFID